MPQAVPIHDWTRVDAGTWHAFHYTWIAEIRNALNRGVLPGGYYADPERRVPPYESDVLTLQEASDEIMDDSGGGVATVAAPAKVTALDVELTRSDEQDYAHKARRLVVRHERGDRIVAILELTSPGNKNRDASVSSFALKAADATEHGLHLTLIDLLPPTSHEGLAGLAGRVAAEAGFQKLSPVEGKPLWVVSIDAGEPKLYAKALAVGDRLPPLPLFYRPGRFVEVPLAETYAAAWESTPKRWRDVVTGERAD